MSIPTLTFSTAALALTLYILHDEIQRTRDKHNTSTIKRPPRYHGWIGITTTLFWASALTILTSTAFCLLGLFLLHKYATHPLNITRSLRRFRNGNNLATETLITPNTPNTNPGLHKNHRRGGVFKSLIVLNPPRIQRT